MRNPARRLRQDPPNRVFLLLNVSAYRTARTASQHGPRAALLISTRGNESINFLNKMTFCRSDRRRTCRQKMFPVATRDRRGCKMFIPKNCLSDDIETIPDGQYSGLGCAQYRWLMTCPVKQRKSPAIRSTVTPRIFSSLTSRSFLVQVTNATAASRTRRQSAGDPQSPCIRPLSEFVDLLNSVRSGRLYAESQRRLS